MSSSRERQRRRFREAGAFLFCAAALGCGPDDASGSWGSLQTGGECDDPASGWIWCDDFERDRLDAYFEYDDAGGAFVRAADVGVAGSHGMRVRFEEGLVDAGFLHLAFGRTPQPYFRPVDGGTRRYTSLYWRHYLRVPEDWVGDGGDKLSRAMILASPDHWGQAMIAHVWSGAARGGAGTHLVIDPASGVGPDGTLATTAYNDFDNLRWLGLASSKTPIFEAPHRGRWWCVEAHVTLDDPGRSNGSFRLWIDGTLQAERIGLAWLGPFQEYGLNAVFVENYWNAGSPVAQERYIDNLVVSTEPIGCAPTESGGVARGVPRAVSPP